MSGDDLAETLAERGRDYGDFNEMCLVIQRLKSAAKAGHGYSDLGAFHKESLDMIFTKIGRIVVGDHNKIDTWHDIAGYATLVEEELEGMILSAEDSVSHKAETK